MSTYLIKLTPIERFYFGSDITFGRDNENSLVRSAYFPQQTTILGMLRYYLLQENELMDSKGIVINQNKADELIGTTGFDPQKSRSYGVINKLSPVFISGPDGEYFAQSREYGIDWLEDEVSKERMQSIRHLTVKKIKGVCSFSQSSIHHFESYSSKTEIPTLLVNARNNRMRFLDYGVELNNQVLKGIFITDQQIGIKLPEKGNKRTPEKGYFKQTGFRMPSGFSFAFYADLNLKQGTSFESGLVKMGADNSMFNIEIIPKHHGNDTIDYLFSREADSLVNPLFKNANDYRKKVVLLSDCFLPCDAYKKSVFASVEHTTFKYLEIITDKNDEADYYKISGGKIQLKKTAEFRTLLRKGSVLYVENESKKEELINTINQAKAFRQIGYNYAI